MFFSKKKSKGPFYDTEFKAIFNNSIALMVIQGTNFILPLLLLPYLISVVGLDKFGVISMAQSVVAFWIIFTNYGFHVSATKVITLNKHDKVKLSAIV